MHTPLTFNRCIHITFRTFCKNCYSRVAIHHASVYNPPKPKTLFQLISSSQASRMAIEMIASETPITSNTLKLNDKPGVWTGTVHGYQHLYSSHISVPLPHPLTWRPGVHSLKKKKKKTLIATARTAHGTTSTMLQCPCTHTQLKLAAREAFAYND